MKRPVILFLLAIAVTGVFAQAKSAEVKIKTSAVCETCKETIEHELSFETGVKKVTLDLDTKVVSVVYNPSKTDENKIRLALTKVGYDADSLKADPNAFKRLPDCCQKPGHE
jgi:periplasmic mercuric ion binding protein